MKTLKNRKFDTHCHWLTIIVSSAWWTFVTYDTYYLAFSYLRILCRLFIDEDWGSTTEGVKQAASGEAGAKRSSGGATGLRRDGNVIFRPSLPPPPGLRAHPSTNPAHAPFAACRSFLQFSTNSKQFFVIGVASKSKNYFWLIAPCSFFQYIRYLRYIRTYVCLLWKL